MPDSLKRRTIQALSWTFVDAIAQRGVQFVIGVVLARILFPEQFGLIGMLTIFMAVIRAFLDSGFGSALIQKRNVTETDVCSVFYFNITVGIVAAIVLCVCAPWIAAFYRQPVLTPLARALSLTIVINSFGLIQRTVLSKGISFKTQTKASLIAGLLSGAIGIVLALSGYGVWSLVGQQLSSAFVVTSCLWLFSDWRPALLFSFDALRQLFGFGSRLLFSSVLNQIFENIYLVVIGRLFSATDLGFFARAKALNDLPCQTLSEMVARVTFPVFATLQDDRERLKRGLRKSLTLLSAVNFPMMIGLMVVAKPLVLVLLTNKWAASIPYLQLLCIAGLLYPLHLMNLNALQALGRADLFFRLEVIKKVLIVGSILLTWRWGIPAMIYGMIAVSVVSYYLNSYYSGQLLEYPLTQQLHDVCPFLMAAVLMGVVVRSTGVLLSTNPSVQIVTQVSIGTLVYAILCWTIGVRFLESFRQETLASGVSGTACQ